MQFICTYASLKRGLHIVRRAVGGRKTHLIESYVLLEASLQSVKLTAFDGTVALEVFVEAEVMRPGRATIKADTFSDWVNKLHSDWSLLLEKGEGVKSTKLEEHVITLNLLRCSAGPREEIDKFLAGKKKTIKVTSEFNGMLPETFPDLPQAQGEKVDLAAASLLGGIQYCRKSVGSNEAQIILTGVHLRLVDDLWLQFVGTNGHRVSIYQVNAPTIKTMGITIPSKALDELKPLLGELKGKDVQIVLGGREGVFNTLLIEYTHYEEDGAGERVYDPSKGWWRASIRLLSSNPPYPVHILDDAHFIPPIFENKVILNRTELLTALERIAVIVDQLKEERNLSAGKVFFEFTKQGRLLLSGDARDAGRTEEEIEIEFTGNPMIIYMEIQYVLDGLHLIDTQTVLFEFNHPLKPIVLKPCGGDTEFKYVVMTIRSHKTKGDGTPLPS